MISNYYGKNAQDYVNEGININAFDFMDNATKNYDSLIAMTYFGREITYVELKQNIMKYANTLRSYGLQKGDNITIVMPNTPEIVYYKYASWILGIETRLVDPRFNSGGIKALANMGDSKLLICELTTFKNKLAHIMDEINTDKILLVSLSDSMDKKISIDVQQSLITVYSKLTEFQLNNVDKKFGTGKLVLSRDFTRKSSTERIKTVYADNMPAIAVFTSGTTGTPKGAVLTHRAYNSKVKQISYGVPNLLPQDKFLAAIPFFSAYGSFAGMHNILCRGMNMFMIPKFKQNDFAKLICKYQINSAIGVPDHWDQFERQSERNKRMYKLSDYSFIKNPVSGGDVVLPKIIDRCNDMFKRNNSDAKLIVGYGSSECGGPQMTTINDDNCYDNEYTGVLFPGIEYLFLNPETKEVLECATEGELAIHDPSMMLGYLNDEENTKRVFIEYNDKKYYITGDLFSVNEKGMFYFKGRVKRAIMRPDGHTVHALPIEEVLSLNEYVDKVCVVGIKRSKELSGCIPTAFIVLKKEIKPTEELAEAIDKFALKHLPERNRALAYSFVSELPYTLMGKVDYKKLENLELPEIDAIFVDQTFKPKNKVLVNKKRM